MASGDWRNFRHAYQWNPADNYRIPTRLSRVTNINTTKTSNLNFTAANNRGQAITEPATWAVCWLYQKALSIANTTPYTPGPWRTWENATERYNGGGVLNYLQRINRTMKEGRHPSNANLYVWPMKSNKKARANP